MKIIRELLLLIVLSIILTSCNAVSSGHPSNLPTLTSLNQNEELSPFIQFQNLKRVETGIDSEQVDDILRLYGIYGSIRSKVPEEAFTNSYCRDVRISGFSVGDKKITTLGEWEKFVGLK